MLLRPMTTTLISNGQTQTLRIPQELRMLGEQVNIRRFGDGLVIEPVRQSAWPDKYFQMICIEDEAFVRLEQGVTPSCPSFD